jgi:hypothetical protein
VSGAAAARAGRLDAVPAVCSAASLDAGEQLAGTATRAEEWLLVERRGAWGRDAVADSGLPERIRTALTAFPGRVQLIRRPDRRAHETVVLRATTREGGGVLTRAIVRAEPGDDEAPAETIEASVAAASASPDAGSDPREPVPGLLLLVCAHGRRDACCARLGVPVYDALDGHVDQALLWQSSHHGGHRFAANVLALPTGVQLGRVAPGDAARVARLLREGRIPLDCYRGRTLYEPHVQAAEAEIRLRLGLDRVTDLELRQDDGERVTFAHPSGAATVTVERAAGPVIPVSCGEEPEETVAYSVRW